jgi:glutamate N-acetyltransferase / amino-acid N-acetyltransferase
MSKNLLRRLTGGIRQYSAPGDGVIPPSKQKYVPDRGTYPTGFVASSAHVGVKPSNTRFDDVALIASTAPCNAAAVFTQNRFQAAPVSVSRDVLKRTGGQGVQAVVVNSGCANAVTGKGGVEDAVAIGETCAKSFGANADSSLVMSTGVIGQR